MFSGKGGAWLALGDFRALINVSCSALEMKPSLSVSTRSKFWRKASGSSSLVSLPSIFRSHVWNRSAGWASEDVVAARKRRRRIFFMGMVNAIKTLELRAGFAGMMDGGTLIGW